MLSATKKSHLPLNQHMIGSLTTHGFATPRRHPWFRPGTGHITLALVDQSVAGRLFKGWIFGHRIGLEMGPKLGRNGMPWKLIETIGFSWENRR